MSNFQPSVAAKAQALWPKRVVGLGQECPMIMTVGDQIFALNQEVKKLRKRCQQYENTLRDIASGKTTPEVAIQSDATTSTGEASIQTSASGIALAR